MLALAIPLDETVQASLLAPAKFSLDAFLKAVGQDFRAAREIVAQVAPLVPDLVTSENKRHATDAHDQGQDNFQSRAHPSSSIQNEMDRARGWTRAAVLNQGLLVTRSRRIRFSESTHHPLRLEAAVTTT
jgi:hypothetical protein